RHQAEKDKLEQLFRVARGQLGDGLGGLKWLLEEEHLGHGPEAGGRSLRDESRARALEVVEGIQAAVGALDECILLYPRLKDLDGRAPRCVRSLCVALWSLEGIAVVRKLPKREYAATAFKRARLTARQAAAVCALDASAAGFADFGEASDLLHPADYESAVVNGWQTAMDRVHDDALTVNPVRTAVNRGEMPSPSPNLKHKVRIRRYGP